VIYTASRSDIALALATVLDWQAAPSTEFDSFGDLADAVCALLVSHEAAPLVPAPEAGTTRVLSAEVRARAEAAGRALGQKRTDFWGRPTGPCAPPKPSRSKRLRDLADAQPVR
jgi:hypothetical protein